MEKRQRSSGRLAEGSMFQNLKILSGTSDPANSWSEREPQRSRTFAAKPACEVQTKLASSAANSSPRTFIQMADETSGETKPKIEGQALQLVVKDQSGTEVHFRVKTKTKFEKIIAAYCSKKALDTKTLRFLHDGQRINGQQTPEELGMEDNEVIDAITEQQGGSWQ
ncbi:hypothetical protein WJX84_001018 [Apatococcus fuscideae]|uniref:Ubiquitin-like domain-containing protein n=1 Tax=Apatococcus fuscideae TaxID=2026836 RepID=A0AAW1SJY2_9CHLO